MSFAHRRVALRRAWNPSRTLRRGAFTLVELLIVIAIIAILATLVVAGLGVAQEAQRQTEATALVTSVKTALENYLRDEGTFPGFGLKPDPDRNDFPHLYRALMYEPPIGGSSAPYLDNPPKEKLVVADGEDDKGDPVYRVAEKDEVEDAKVDKYILDPWGKPYVYRCNKGIAKLEDFMVHKTYDIYSLGKNGEDDTAAGLEGDENDDVINN
jgi:prepilin-type N-terminal cleavage/methylation domain-containing protein